MLLIAKSSDWLIVLTIASYATALIQWTFLISRVTLFCMAEADILGANVMESPQSTLIIHIFSLWLMGVWKPSNSVHGLDFIAFHLLALCNFMLCMMVYYLKIDFRKKKTFGCFCSSFSQHLNTVYFAVRLWLPPQTQPWAMCMGPVRFVFVLGSSIVLQSTLIL